MFEFLETANELAILLTGLIGLICTGISTFFAIKNWLKTLREKTREEQWKLLMEIADAAMAEAETSSLAGESKKTMAIDIINASTKTAGIDISLFASQLDDYIEETIAFVNKMTKNK